jgi:hypothetical protein
VCDPVFQIVVSETNKGKKALLYEGFTYRIDFVLKSEDISWRCTKRGCKAKLRTDKDIEMVISGKLDHTHEVDERKLERKQIRLSVKRKANSDVSERPTKIIRSELQRVEENNLYSLSWYISMIYPPILAQSQFCK